MVIQVKNIVLVGGFDATMKGAPTVIRRSMKAMARTWHRRYLPGHFQPGAKRKYRYDDRTPGYRRTKQRLGLAPIVFSGRTRAQARALFRVTGSRKTVRGRFFLPNYIRMKPFREGLPAIGEELTRVTRFEAATLVRGLEADVNIGLRKIRTRRVIKL